MSHIVNSCPQTNLEGGWAAAIALSWMTELLKLEIWEQFVIIYFFPNVLTILMLSVVCTFGLPDVDEHAISNNDLASAQQRHTQTVHKAMVRWDRMRTHHSTWSDVPTAEFIKQLKQKKLLYFSRTLVVLSRTNVTGVKQNTNLIIKLTATSKKITQTYLPKFTN